MNELKKAVEALSQSELELVHCGKASEVEDLIRSKGVCLDGLSTAEALRTIRDAIANLTDDELAQAAGGEIGKVLGITVAAVTGSVVAGAIAGGVIGSNYASH